MIACDVCDEWYHCNCIDYMCAKCERTKKEELTKNEIQLQNQIDTKTDEITMFKNQLKYKKKKKDQTNRK